MSIIDDEVGTSKKEKISFLVINSIALVVLILLNFFMVPKKTKTQEENKSFVGKKKLSSQDSIGFTFWIISVALAATTVFLLFESIDLTGYDKTSILVSSSVTFIAAVHYFYMRDYWIHFGKSPISYRYIDWLLTVPLQLLEFYLILKIAGQDTSSWFPFMIIIPSIIMLVSGYLSEICKINRIAGGFLGLVMWGYVLYLLWTGIDDDSVTKNTKDTYETLFYIVAIGWALYPIGFFIKNTKIMNGLYNIADFINKILFVLVIWYYVKYK